MLAMVVVGGLVGAQGLGLVVVQGFSQHTSRPAGSPPASRIVLLGVMLDRITQGPAGPLGQGVVVDSA